MPSVGALRAEIAREARRGNHNRADTIRQEYYTRLLAERIRTTLDKAPPLTETQLDSLRSLLVAA
jgi:hypothetical protein